MKKKRLLALLLSFVMLFIVGCGKNKKNNDVSESGSKAGIAGYLLDQNENALVGKTVKLLEVESKKSHEALTEEGGEFYFSDLSAQEYKLSVLNDDGTEVFFDESYTLTVGQNLFLKVVFDGTSLAITLLSDTVTDESETSDTNQTNQTNQTDTNSSVNSSGSKTSGQTTSKLDPKTDPVLASLKGTTIKVMSWNVLGDVTGAPEAVKKFKDATGINVQWIMKPYGNGDYQTTLATMVAGNNSPDVLRLRELDPALLKNMQPLSVTGDDFSSEIWDKRMLQYYSLNGKAYAVNRNDTLIQQPRVIMYNASLISKYYLDDPYTLWKQGKWTWDNFIRLCNEFKSESNLPAWSAYNPVAYANIIGKPLAYVKNGRFLSNVGDSELIRSIQKIVDLKSKGIVGKYFDEGGFDKGEYLFMTNAIIGARKTHFAVPQLKSSNSLGVVPYPTIPGKTNYMVFNEAEAYGVAKGARNPKAVPYFLQYYLDDSNYEEKSFFNSSQILDVYKNMMKSENYNFYDDVLAPVKLNGGSSGTVALPIFRELMSATVDQLTGILERLKNPYEGGIKFINDTLDTIK